MLTSKLVKKSAFSNLAKGMKREEINKIDPSTCIFDNISYH